MSILTRPLLTGQHVGGGMTAMGRDGDGRLGRLAALVVDARAAIRVRL
jgi:hypothetical protein